MDARCTPEDRTRLTSLNDEYIVEDVMQLIIILIIPEHTTENHSHSLGK